VLISYIRDCSNAVLQLFAISSVFFVILSVILFMIPRFSASKANKNNTEIKERLNMGIKIKYSASLAVFILIISVLAYNTSTLKKEFYSNDFQVVMSKIKNANTVTQVISAKDTVIYSLLIKIVDKKAESLYQMLK
jgi:nitrogen fixation/metabolism regulation signal transduction histidine kinase